jgi:membrane fusion protein, multidrug efflux system
MNGATQQTWAERLSRHRWRIAFAVAGGIALAIGFSWHTAPRHLQKALAGPVPVDAGHAIQADFPIFVEATGTVTPRNVTDVKVRVDSALQRVNFVEGQDVKAGQVLAELDRSVFSAQLDQALANQSRDQATLENARLDLERYRKLGPLGAATAQSIDAAKARVDELTATLAADAAAVRNSRLQVGFTTLVAPFDGRVGMQEAYVGAVLHASDPRGVVTVTQIEPIDVEFAVPQGVLPKLQGTAALPVEVFTRSGGKSIARGTLDFVDSRIDPTSGEINLKAVFVNADRHLWPGQLVDARILVRTDTGRVALPDHAILHTQEGSKIYVVDAAGKVALRGIVPGPSVSGLTEIEQGVAAGEMVVFDGQSRLNPGARVKVSTVDAHDAARAATESSTDASMPS